MRNILLIKAISYTKLVKTGEIGLEHLINLMSTNPSNRFGLDIEIAEGKDANLCVFDLDEEYKIDANEFYSMGKCTPFADWKVYGKCLLNFTNGKKVFEK